MADTQRTRSALLALFADNVTGQISAQDFRDFLVTIMNGEFKFEGDFWTQPDITNTDTGDTARGWKQYSQTIDSGASFGIVMCYTPSETWRPAGASGSVTNGVLGVAMGSYASGDADCEILRKGMVYHSDMSADFNGNIGRVIFLNSVSGAISALAVDTALSMIIGYVADDTTGKWFFDPKWEVVGT